MMSQDVLLNIFLIFIGMPETDVLISTVYHKKTTIICSKLSSCRVNTGIHTNLDIMHVRVDM